MSLIEQYRQAHQERPDWWQGMSLWPHIERIEKLVQATGAKTVLDYGCGKGRQYQEPVVLEDQAWPNLEAYWGVTVTKYDPAVPGFDDTLVLAGSEGYDGTICTDVLEHCADPIEAGTILHLLFGKARQFVFLSVSTAEAVKFLPDGQNAHTLLRPADWWLCAVEMAARRPDVRWKLVCDGGKRIFTGGPE